MLMTDSVGHTGKHIFLTEIVQSEVIHCTYLCCDEDNVMLAFVKKIRLVMDLKIHDGLTARVIIWLRFVAPML